MNEKLSRFIECFDKCLNMIGGNSTYDKDSALAMTFILMEREVFVEKDLADFSLELTERCLDLKEMVDNVIVQPSPNTSLSYNYCYHPNTMKSLAKYGALNVSTLNFVFEKLNQEIIGARGSSSMSEGMNNIQGKAASAVVINDCINIMEN